MGEYKVRLRPKNDWDKFLDSIHDKYPQFSKLATKKFIDDEEMALVDQVIREYHETDRCFELSIWTSARVKTKELSPVYSRGNNYKFLYYWYILSGTEKSIFYLLKVRSVINNVRELESEWDKAFYRWSQDQIKVAIKEFGESGRSPRTVAVMKNTLAIFCKWASKFDPDIDNYWPKLKPEREQARVKNSVEFISLEELQSQEMKQATIEASPKKSLSTLLAAYLIFHGATVDDTNDYGLCYIKNSDVHDGMVAVDTPDGKRGILLTPEATRIADAVLMENERSNSPYLIRPIRNQDVPAPMKRWAVNYKLRELSEEYFDGERFMGYRMLRRSGRLSWIREMAMRFYAKTNITRDEARELLRLNYIEWGELNKDQEISKVVASRMERQINEWYQYKASPTFERLQLKLI